VISEPLVVAGDDLLSVWREAYELLLDEGNRFNLTLHVRDPRVYDHESLSRSDPGRVVPDARSLLDVANTIFPARSARWDKPLGEFSEHYGSAYERLLRRGVRSWGAYFVRLISFGGRKINQLDRVVAGLNGWGHNHKAAFVVHFTSSETDKPRPLGAPCLQYVQFSVTGDNQLSMTAVYRSHDYFHKALGNLLGLSRLLEYVAEKTNHGIGTLTCLSSYAFVDVSRDKATALLKVKDD
jgi:thymidylate synthase